MTRPIQRDILAGLNEAQRAVVLAATNRPVLVVAGAGTGKTRTLLRRLQYLVEKRSVPANSILTTTFSNRAARELRERLEHDMPDAVSQIRIKTFHSLGYAIIMRHFKLAGFSRPPGVLSDTKKRREIWRRAKFDAMTEEESARKCYANLGKMPPLNGDTSWSAVLVAIQSHRANIWKRIVSQADIPNVDGSIDHVAVDDMSIPERRCLSEAAFYSSSSELKEDLKASLAQVDRAKCDGHVPPGSSNDCDIAAPWELYQQYLRELNMLDFGDMLTIALNLIEKCNEVRDLYRSRYRVALVDEFQDNNLAQVRLILALNTPCLTVVGDDDQSIYEFRGAIRSVFPIFRSMLNERGITTAQRLPVTLMLEDNYRSSPEIIRLARSIVEPIAQRENKQLRPTKPSGAAVEILSPRHDEQVASDVFDRIRALRSRDPPVPFRKMAVLFRAFKRMYEPVAHLALQRAFMLATPIIPCVVVRAAAIMESKEILDMSAYLRLTLDPSDDDAFTRVMTRPNRACLGRDSKTRKQMSALMQAGHAASLWHAAILLVNGNRAVSAASDSSLRGLLGDLNAITTYARQAFAGDTIKFVIEQINYTSFRDDEEAKKRKADAKKRGDLEAEVPDKEKTSDTDPIKLFRRMGCSFDLAWPVMGNDDNYARFDDLSPAQRAAMSPEVLLDLLTTQSRGPIVLGQFLAQADLDADGNDDERDAVQISTIHQSKGLEWPHVFVPNFESNFLKHRSMAAPSEEDEERRIFHVACTRGMDTLSITKIVPRPSF